MNDEAARSAQAFYTRWARLYDVLARHAPGVGRLRVRAANALALEPGDTVVDLGCGTGATLPTLRERVGPAGTVFGVDFSPGALARARTRVRERGWENVTLLRGDIARPPLCRPVDAVLGSFVTGMLADPAAAVGTWLDLLEPGGWVVLLDAASGAHPLARPLDAAFAAFVRLGAPGGPRYAEPPVAVLNRRVSSAHGELQRRATDPVAERDALGFVWLTGGRA